MPGLAELFFAFFLVIGGHEINHDLMADRENIPFSQRGVTGYLPDTSDDKKVLLFASAGFEGQEIVTGALEETKLKRSTHLVSGFNKIGYALIPNSITGGIGDVQRIEQHGGEKARKMAQGALAVSAISDLLTAFDIVEGDTRFIYGQSSNGTPMLIFAGRF